MKKNN
ncbi:Protein of unknown function [Bacillus thuringiensis]